MIELSIRGSGFARRGLTGSSSTPLIKLPLQQFLRGQVELILFRVDVCVFRQSEFDDGLFGGFAEEEADGGVLVGQLYLAVVAVHARPVR